jgi:dTDP-4-amino-4,6-dideoxygalactose transaminase
LEPIPFLSLAHQNALVHDAVTESLKHSFEKNWYILGDDLKKFEGEYAKFSNVEYCLGVGNGYDALSIALRACNVGPGDEVIIPAHTYVATWLAVSNCGASIVPVEPEIETMLIDPKKIENLITPKTKVILPVHLYGYPCNMTLLGEIAQRRSIKIIEDNAQAHGARWNNKPTGSFGVANATSFYPTKNLGALGDGGAVTTNNKQIADFVRRYRNYGFERKNYCEVQGINSRLDELQAALLSIKLARLNEWNQQRRDLANHYITRLKDIGDIQIPVVPKEAFAVYHLFVIRTSQRDKLRKYLDSSGIETMIHYPIPPHLQKAYATLDLKREFPLTERIATSVLSLPLWPGLQALQIDYICDRIKTFFSR